MSLLFKRTIFILLTISYMAFIWIQSSRFDPESLAGITSSINRTVFLLIGAGLEFAHLFQFGLLYLFIILIFSSFGMVKTWHEVTAAVIALVYGVVDEVHQLFVPFRSFSWLDLFKDVIGILFFWWWVHKSYFTNKHSKFGNWLKRLS